MSKKGLKKKLTFWLAPKIIHVYLRLVGWTGPTIWLGKEHVERFEAAGEPCVFAMWHHNATQATWALRGRGLAVLVSSSDDGELATRVLESFGNLGVRGSSSKGGAKALLKMIRWIKTGKGGIITPDGPRGPTLKVQPGTIVLASKSGAALVPFHMESKDQWTAERSWDKHRFPKLFTTKVISLGEPIFIPPKLSAAEAEFWREKVEQGMIQNQEKVALKLESLG